MGKHWIERKDADFAGQAQNFANRIAADPESFALTPTEAGLLTADCDDFIAKFKAATVPNMWSRGATNAKDQARRKLAARMREYGARIRANQSIPDAAKIQLSLTVPSEVQSTPLGRPDSRPRVTIQRIVSNLIYIRLQDQAMPYSYKRPRGVLGAQLYFTTGEDPSTTRATWQPAGVTMSSKATIRLPALPPGTQVWIAARWFNNRGQMGPASNPRCTYVASMVVPNSLAA